eukprot:SAG22_NODE_14523_length_372_cov_1.128205_1_plen_36_part_10
MRPRRALRQQLSALVCAQVLWHWPAGTTARGSWRQD